MTVTARKATASDADAIYAYWESTVTTDPSFLCSPGMPYPLLETLQGWLAGTTKLVVVTEDETGQIVGTGIYETVDAQLIWIRSTNATIAEVWPVGARFAAATLGMMPWGFVGIAALNDLFVSFPGTTEDANGVLHWVGP